MDTLRITLVDDDSIFCFLFKNILEQYPRKKISLEVYPEGHSALEAFRKTKSDMEKYPHLLFIDINMPLLNGWELLDTIHKEDLFELRVVNTYIISSSISNVDRESAIRESKKMNFLSKPINSEDLFRILDDSEI